MGSPKGIRRAPSLLLQPQDRIPSVFWGFSRCFFFFFGHYYQIAWVWIPDAPLLYCAPYRALLDLSVLLELCCSEDNTP